MVAPLEVNRIPELRSLLATMNSAPGTADPDNPIIPFGQLEALHFARIVVLEDQTLDDITTAYGIARRDYPTYLAFLADFDGDADQFRRELITIAGDGLRKIFSFCVDFPAGANLFDWMKQREHPPSATYVNWVGRGMQQIREDDALRRRLQSHFLNAKVQHNSPEDIWRNAKDLVKQEVNSRQLKLTPLAKAPLSLRLKNLVHLIFVPVVLLIFSPVLIVYLPFFIFQLRHREKHDPEIAPPPTADHARRLASLEDHDVTNQFTAMGSLKPGVFRRWLLVFLLWIVQYTTRHIYTRGRLARVSTIHFARWVFIDNKRRLVFCSNYDGSLESYMDDFINKVAFGLNVVFSNGIGYPRTNWLVFQGAKDEQRFKHFIRRHELPTEVWYNGHSGLTNFDLVRNARIREGIEQHSMTNAQAGKWLELL